MTVELEDVFTSTYVLIAQGSTVDGLVIQYSIEMVNIWRHGNKVMMSAPYRDIPIFITVANILKWS